MIETKAEDKVKGRWRRVEHVRRGRHVVDYGRMMVHAFTLKPGDDFLIFLTLAKKFGALKLHG